MDSCFHLSLCLGCFCSGCELLQENEMLFFLSVQCLPGPPSEPCSMVSLSPTGCSTCLLSGHHKAGFGRNKIFPPFPSCDPSPKMKADCSFLTNSLYLALPLPNVSCCHTAHSIAHASATLFCSGVHAF